MKIHKPKTIKEAINGLEGFFEADMWYAKHAEWKTEEDMLRYLRSHFDIFRKQMDELIIKLRYGCGNNQIFNEVIDKISGGKNENKKQIR